MSFRKSENSWVLFSGQANVTLMIHRRPPSVCCIKIKVHYCHCQPLSHWRNYQAEKGSYGEKLRGLWKCACQTRKLPQLPSFNVEVAFSNHHGVAKLTLGIGFPVHFCYTRTLAHPIYKGKLPKVSTGHQLGNVNCSMVQWWKLAYHRLMEPGMHSHSVKCYSRCVFEGASE